MLAEGVMQDPSVIAKMRKRQRLSGPQARERVLAVVDWLRTHTALETIEEANALLAAAGMSPLREDESMRRALQASRPAPSAPDRPSSVSAGLRTNLPAPLTSFVGRLPGNCRIRWRS